MFKLLQHQDAASFPASSALALGIEGPHGATRIIASRGDCANDAKGHGIESRYSSVGASADRDDSVGYNAEEWRCMRCGVNCEYWISVAQPAYAGEPATIQESDERRTLRTLNHAAEQFASVVFLLPEP